eukprot:s577_g18.t1
MLRQTMVLLDGAVSTIFATERRLYFRGAAEEDVLLVFSAWSKSEDFRDEDGAVDPISRHFALCAMALDAHGGHRSALWETMVFGRSDPKNCNHGLTFQAKPWHEVNCHMQLTGGFLF